MYPDTSKAKMLVYGIYKENTMISYEKWMIEYLTELPELKSRLESTNNPYERHYIERTIVDRERLLSQLTEQERLIIERVVINGEKAATVAFSLGLTPREVHQRKNAAMEMLLYLRHGAGYRP